ncbi:alpha/beta hydrolase [Streptomyces sp. NPDC048603]|uniref:alpha/beta hydrolase n=1 Tax=Streptomyces sp. NPDC048603 TaxID=3365577 RepID=UPI00371F6A0A
MRRKPLAQLLAAAGLMATTVPLLTATQATAAGAEAAYLKQKPNWQRCAADQPAAYECATLKVPLDYRRPEGRKIDLAISRIKSTNPAKRQGILLSNPGGPGGPGLDMPLLMHQQMPANVRDQYDLIGFDPRGVGKSSPITCGLTEAEQNFDRAYRPGTYAADVAWARTVADKCREKSGDVLRHITTRNTARDMDTVRAVLGEKKTSFVGYSYGTYLGAVYSQMFPQRTDRFVLDSAVDPQRAWRGMIQVWATEAEPAYQRWTRWAAERNAAYGLGSTPEAVSKTFWGLVAQADRKPIDFFGSKLKGDDIRAGRALFFYPQQASDVIKQLKAAAEGKPMPKNQAAADDLRKLLPGTLIADAYAGRATGAEPGVPADNGSAVFWAVVCGDTAAWPRYTEQYARDAAADKKKYPLYGDMASNIKPCAFWDRPAEAATPMNKPANVLTVQNEWDSQTPLVSGQGMHRALKGSRMVLAAGGEGHAVYLFDPRSCVNAPVNDYLATGRLPAKDLTCKNPPADASRRVAPSPSQDRQPMPFPQGTPRF